MTHLYEFTANDKTYSIAFDGEAHQYKINGVIRPSTTQVMDHFGLMKGKEFFTIHHSQRGTYVHEAIKMYTEGILDEKSMDPRLIPYLDSFKLWEKDFGYKHIANETICYDPDLEVCGTLDTFGRMSGVDGIALIDYKTGVVGESVGFQLASYKRLLRLSNRFPETEPIHKFALKLDPKGKRAKLIPFTDEGVDRMWVSMALLYRWKRENGYPMEAK